MESKSAENAIAMETCEPAAQRADDRLSDKSAGAPRQVAVVSTAPMTIAISATFTADLLRDPLLFWMRLLEIPVDVPKPSYAQVMQELLDPTSALARNSGGINILLIRMQDWIADTASDDPDGGFRHVAKVKNDLVAAIGALRGRTNAPLFIFFGPSSSSLPPAWLQALEQAKLDLASQLSSLAHVHCWTHADLDRLYPIVGYEDPRADQIGHIPYTNDYFVAVATLMARRAAALFKLSYKVIAVDCDNTLWQGICGEDDVHGIELTPAHIRFQQLLVRQQEAGVLLCLCSKNNAVDVESVFRSHPQMPLREEHLVCSRVNWSAKSANLEAIAQELDLSLDSFIFIDDSAMECAEVRAHCPSVLVLQFPDTTDTIAHFIDHVWAFDRVGVTREARGRTAMYRQNRSRKLALQEAADLEQFLASLELEVEVAYMHRDQLPRVAELIQRTNQFNMTAIRRHASELEASLASGELRCLTVHARDRFGDYGMVGAVLFRFAAAAIEVDTFVLSCRVLSRGVEHRIVNELGKLACDAQLRSVVLRYRKTARNTPARSFLETSFQQFRSTQDAPDGSFTDVFRVPAQSAVELRTRSASDANVLDELKTLGAESVRVSGSAKWHDSVFRLGTLPAIVQEMHRCRQATRLDVEYVPPRTPTEAALADIWCEVLALDRLSVRADFFEVGGDSVRAVQAIARIEAVLGLELSVYDFFEGQTIEEIANRLASASASGSAIGIVDRSAPLPLSWAQQRLWFIEKLEGGNAAYNVPMAVRLRGRLNMRVLHDALNALIERHEVLRTLFVEVNGEPQQKVLPAMPVSLGPTVVVGPDEVLQHMRDESAALLDLSGGPLVRGKLLRLADSEHVLIVTMHHMVADGWSIGVLVRELAALLDAYGRGQPDPLPNLPVQYADYAQWQRSWQTRPESQEELQYWKDQLQDAPELLPLPTDRPRPEWQTYRGDNVRFTLESALTAELKALARRLNLTLAMTLYAAWAIVLARLSGADDVVIGMPVANRRRIELERLVGLFVNMLPVRVRLDDDPPLADLLQRVKKALLAAYANQNAPFEKVVEVLRPVRSLSHSPIFQVVFVLQDATVGEIQLPELTLVEEEVLLGTAQFDLSLSLRDGSTEISGILNYATDLFDASTIEQWARCFKSVLGAMVRTPQANVSTLSLLEAAEGRAIIELLNRSPSSCNQHRLIHELFEEQVQRTPQSLAVTCEGHSLTYSEVNNRADRLAAHLRHKGVEPGQLIAICVERSLEMVIGLLGILKADAVYVPLDPTYPTERLQYMLQDAAPRFLLTQKVLEATLPQTATERITLDELLADFDPSAPIGCTTSRRRDAHQLAYVIYTSGSTGKPKGVMVEHANVTRLFAATRAWFEFNEQDVWSLFHSFAFDFSVWELWGALLHGGRVLIVPYLTARAPEEFYRLLCREKVTVLNQTPSAFAQLVTAQARAGDIEHSLRVVIFGGEALEFRTLRPWVARNGVDRPRLINMYGITETTVHVTYRPLAAGDIESERSSLIGRPIPDLRMYVLDRHRQPVPIGVVAELYVGGAGVARGYLNQPELTGARFQSDPFVDEPGARLYKTGDLARVRADGDIEYLGRNDQQVKIRGFRIELGEIEAQLATHELVNDAVVIVREDVPGEKRLVAYVVPLDSANVPTGQALRKHVAAVLPEHMVPSGFVALEQMPLTANGKLDRKALPKPDAYASRSYEPPQGELEIVLVAIWQDLLRTDRVGRNDNFFELGGHSLLLVQMMEQLRRRGLSADVRSIYVSQTLADLARALVHDRPEETAAPPNLIPPGCEAITPQMLPLIELRQEQIERIAATIPGGMRNIRDVYPLAPLQEGILFHHVLSEHGADVYVTATLLSLASRKRVDDVVAAFQSVVDRHDSLRSAVLWEDLPQPLQVVYRRASLPLQETELDPDRDPLVQIEEWVAPKLQRLDLRRAPLLRLRIAADPRSERWYMLLQAHHILGDNASQELMISEVATCLQGQAHLLPAPVSYRGHVAQALASARTRDAESFFRSKLAGVDGPTLAFGVADVHGDGSNVEEFHQVLDATLTQQIRDQAQRAGVSPATLFHAAWALVVACTSGREDVVLGTVLLGRLHGRAGAQRMLGMFINTLPLRLTLRSRTARQLLEHTQHELAELLDHEQASLAQAQRCAGISGSTPLFNTLINYRHELTSPDARWSTADGIQQVWSRERTNFPLSLSVDEGPGGFTLTIKADGRIGARRVISYVHTALSSLTDALLRGPQIPAAALRVLPSAEEDQVTRAFNATSAAYPDDKLIHEAFEEQVRQTPDAEAVIFQEQSITYAELNARANQLARFLRERGVRPDQTVGLCVERGIEMVVGMLAILKAGGAYVPMDPDHPPERLRHIVDETRVRLVLSQARTRAAVEQVAAESFALDVDWAQLSSFDKSNLDPDAVGLRSQHLAYVIYTSGSTGRPKGVMIEHRNVLSLWQGLEQVYRQVGRCWRVAVNASYTFDASVKQFIQLAFGRTVVIVPQHLRWDASQLLSHAGKQQVDAIDCTPSQLKAWLAAGLLDRNDHRIRLVLIGGEPIDAGLWLTLSHSSAIEFFNVYGPTESTVDTTFARVNGDSLLPHIGRPMENRRVYILGLRSEPVPIGVTGEVHIGGAGVARGYLGQPELTAKHFLADPFSPERAARMYRTGDLGRWRADGTIEYVGRRDHQVKIRGFRIEVEEIETHLMRLSDVRAAAVAAWDGPFGEKRLIAYVVGRDPPRPPAVDALRAQLRQTLPEYMVPSAFVLLDSMPLTANGKVDRRALPAPQSALHAVQDLQQPRGEVEEMLAAVWCDLLGIDRVGREDNFFELGGHSLLIVRMLDRLRRFGLSAEVQAVFESPTLADLARLLRTGTVDQFHVPPNLIPSQAAAITPDMLTLVDFEPEQLDQVLRSVPGGASNIQDIYPLTPLQEGILFHHLLSVNGADTYVVPIALEVSSAQRRDELIAALQAVVDRHDMLRTGILWKTSPPLQVVYRRAMLPVELLELRPNLEPNEQVGEWLNSSRQRLDLSCAPLMRVGVAPRPHSDKWYVLLQLHHIVADATSVQIIVSEVIAQLQGRTEGLQESIPFRNHVAQTLAQARAQDADAYFRSKLGDVEEPTAPFGLTDVYGDGAQVREDRKQLESQLAARLRMQARRLNVGVAALFHAACGLVVACTSGREDVIFGSVLLGRMHSSAGAQKILGMFINTLPLRLDMRNATASELVEMTQRELVGLLTHEQASLAAAQRCSGIVGNAPLFTTLFNYRHKARDLDVRWSDAAGIEVRASWNRTNYPLTISVDDLGDGFTVTAQVDRRIDPQRIIEYLITSLGSLVRALEEAPNAPALGLIVLSDAERELVLEAFNAMQAPFPRDGLVHRLFEEQVARTPNAAAIVSGDESLTYAEVDALANRLVLLLRQHRVAPDRPVALFARRSVRMVIGVLATLKAGAPYMPLDPNYPPERLQYMLKHARPTVVLTDSELRDALPQTDATVIELDSAGAEGLSTAEGRSVAAGSQELTSDSLVYVIYTSGSTGLPKGVQMSHRSMVNLIEWHRATLSAEGECRVLQFAALSFDVAFQELFSTLCTGGTLVLVDELTRRDPRALLECMRAQRIHRLFVPPLMLQSLAERVEANPGLEPLCLRDVIAAGEQLRISPQIAGLIRRMNVRLHNHYGPTETHVVTALTLRDRADDLPVLPSIGKPVFNCRIYVLNSRREPVPIGVIGEIFIGGACVARGYLGRPDLTAERFLPDPFAADPPARMYKTGDLGRWHEDGTLEYLGRNDDQVKIRGYRIELGEIEAQLALHEKVREAALVAREDTPGAKRLVAYVTCTYADAPSAEELRAHLKASLPEYMLPSAFVVLDKLPLTPSGKLNRRELPAPEGAAYASSPYSQPEGPTEEAMAVLWQELLGVEKVGRTDNFFELGGHSLHGMKLIMRVEQRFTVSLSVVAIFRYPTVQQLAAMVDSLRAAVPSQQCQELEMEEGTL